VTIDPAAGAAFDADRAARRNYRLSIWNGVLFNVGETFIETATIVALFVSGLTDRGLIVGLAVALQDVGWHLPQVLTIALVEGLRRRLPLYAWMAFLRTGGLLAATLAILLLGDRHPQWTLGLFLVFYAVYSFAGGFAAVSFYDVVGRTIPMAWHARMWAWRLFFGGLLAAACGFLLQRILALPDFSLRFGLLFGAATLFIGAGVTAFSLCHEPPAVAERRARRMGDHLRESARVAWRDPAFRALFGTRVALAGAFTAAPFFVLFALGPLGLEPQAAGGFVTARIGGFVLANLLWQQVATRRGPRSLMRAVALASALAPAFVLAAAIAPGPWRPPLLLAAFVLVGAAVSGTNIGYQSLLLAIAPAARRPSYVGWMNSFIGPFMLLPAAAGWLADLTSPHVVFAGSLAAALLAAGLASRLPADPAPEAPRSPGPEGEPAHAA
jgi:hypothetical protein